MSRNFSATSELLARLVDRYHAEFANITSSTRSRLDCAVIRNEIDEVKSLIAEGCNVNEGPVTPLHLAVHFCPEAVSLLIKAGANVNAKTSYKITPLHLAAQECKIDLVNKLLNAKANVNAADFENATPLHLAVGGGWTEVAEVLINAGANINVKTKENATPLHYAAQKGYIDIIKMLVDKKTKINIKKLEGFTPLHLAIQHRQPKVTEYLINNGADINAKDDEGWAPIHNVVYSGYPAEIARLLISKGANVNERENMGRTPLHLAAEHDFVDMVKILIEHKADVNATDNRKWTPLHSAAYDGCLETVKILIESGAKVDPKTRNKTTPLHFAADYWHEEVVKYLLERGADVNAADHTGWTPLHFTVEQQFYNCPSLLMGCSDEKKKDNGTKLRVVKALIVGGADVNFKAEQDEAPIHIAAKSGNLDIVKCLLDSGAYFDIQAISIYGKRLSALNYAMVKKNTDVVNFLKLIDCIFDAVKKEKIVDTERFLKNGSVVNFRSVKNETPLIYASWKGYANIVNVLIKYHADVNLVSANGFTPLHYAAKFGHYAIVCTLLASGAIFNAESKKCKKTPLHFAVANNNSSIIQLLEQIGQVFERVKSGNCEVDSMLKEIRRKTPTEFHAIVGCKNESGKNLEELAESNEVHEITTAIKDLKVNIKKLTGKLSV